MAEESAKGLRTILAERGTINTVRMKADDMRTMLSNHDDFMDKKVELEYYIEGRRHVALFLPKFHCELNPI